MFWCIVGRITFFCSWWIGYSVNAAVTGEKPSGGHASPVMVGSFGWYGVRHVLLGLVLRKVISTG